MESGRYAGKTNSGFLSKYEFNKNLFLKVAFFLISLGFSVFIVFYSVTFGNPAVTENGQGGASANQFSFCDAYQSESVYCKEAAEISLEKYPGTIENVSKGLYVNKQTGADETLWIFDVNLETPALLSNYQPPEAGKNQTSTTLKNVYAHKMRVYFNQVTKNAGGELFGD